MSDTIRLYWHTDWQAGIPIKLKAALSARRVQTLNKPGSYADGGGLELIVRDGSRKTWTLRIMVGGRRIVRGLGSYPRVSLADARALAVEYREALLAGRDPSAEARAEREAEKAMKEARGWYTYVRANGLAGYRHPPPGLEQSQTR